MHWAVPCISNLAKRESEAAPKSRRLQMMARVRLDVSHVSSCVTARREKVTRYKRVSQRTFEVHARSDYTLYAWEFLSVCSWSIWWFSHWLERWSAIGRSGAALFFCRFLRWIVTKDGGWSGAHVDPSLTRSVPTFWSTGRIKDHESSDPTIHTYIQFDFNIYPFA